MEINTKYFGKMSYETNEVIFFKNGLFGFENQKEYILIRFEDDNDFLLSLQSITDETLAFVVVNPYYLMPTYTPFLTEADLTEVEANNLSQVTFYNICVVRDNVSESTVNFKCPLIINHLTQKAKQVILEDSCYNLRHKFGDFAKKEIASN